METTTETPKIEFDLSKFPFLSAKKRTIERDKKLVDLYNLRIKLSKENWQGLSEYEKNEREILSVETDIQLAKAHTRIIQQEKHITEYMESISKHIDEVNEKFDELNATALQRAEKNDEIKEFMDKAKLEEMADNWEFKIHHYITLKHLIKESGKIKKLK